MSWTYLQGWQLLWSTDRESLERARALAEKASALNDNLVGTCHVLGQVYLWMRQHDRAIEQAERGVALAPNDADGYETLAEILGWSGRAAESIVLIRRAMRLNPHFEFYYLWTLGHGYYLTERRQEALDTFAKLLQANPNFFPAYALRAVLFSELGRMHEAREAWSQTRKLIPSVSMDSLRERIPYKRPADLDRLLSGMHRAAME